MCKETTSVPDWCVKKINDVWQLKVSVSEPPELEINAEALRLKLDASSDSLTLPFPEQALPVDPDTAKCKFSKRRGELVIEWPCGAETMRTEYPKPLEGKAEAAAPRASSTQDLNAATEDKSRDTAVVSESVSVIKADEKASEIAAEEGKEDDSDSSTTAPEATGDESDSTAVPAEEAKEDASTTDEQDDEPSPSAEEWKARGNAAVKSGDHEMALQCYTSGISKVGGDSEAEALLRSNRAMCLHKLSRYQEAANDAKRCVDLKPDFVKGYLRGAMALRACGQPAEALALLKRAPVNDEACSLAAEIRPEAEASEKARIEALPEAERTKEEGNVLFRKGRFEAAAEKYGEALSLCADQEGSLALAIRNNRAACFHQVSDFTAVIKDTTFVLERDPQNIKALIRRMLALEPLERYEQALRDARVVLSQDPRNEMANKVQHRLGKLVRDLNRTNGAA